MCGFFVWKRALQNFFTVNQNANETVKSCCFLLASICRVLTLVGSVAATTSRRYRVDEMQVCAPRVRLYVRLPACCPACSLGCLAVALFPGRPSSGPDHFDHWHGPRRLRARRRWSGAAALWSIVRNFQPCSKNTLLALSFPPVSF